MKLHTGIAAVALMAGACWGQNEGAEIVDRVLAHYKGLQGCSVTLSLEIDAGDSPMAAMLSEMGQTSFGYAVKPNLFAFWPGEGGGMGMPSPRVWSDGTKLVEAIPDSGVYSVGEAPAGFAELHNPGAEGEMPTSTVQMIPGADILLQLMSDDPSETIGEMLTGAEFKGQAGEGDDAHFVFLAADDSPMSEGMEMEVHIAAVGEPWIVGLVPQLEDQGAMMEGVTVKMGFADWKAVETAPDAGRIEIDSEWEKVDNVLEAAMGNMMMGGDMEEPDEGDEVVADTPPGAGVGQPAAPFSLEQLGGGTFTLADHKGKVVVLDFWATWCGPCVAGLPVVTSVTKEYAPKGVVFAAVNLEEDPKLVAEFMKKKGWEFTVALDSDSAVSNLYGVTGIPHSVIIDKQGVIRHVQVGFGGAAQAEKQLREELDELIAE